MSPTRSPSALVIDDSAAMRQQLCYALQRVLGVSPVEAADGAEAWRRLSAGRFDIVITDINMPLLDGLKLIALVRGDRSPHRFVPIVVITTEGAEADRVRAMDLGASKYLVKPPWRLARQRRSRAGSPLIRGRDPDGLRPTGRGGTPRHGVMRSIIRANGMVSRTWCRPQIQATQRSTPMPKPACGTVP
jgi:two-component system, chemotaxis family, chemotaxis protein CheY